VGGEVGEAGNGVVAFAVVGLGITDRTGKMAATKNVAGEIHPAGIGNGLKIGIGPRLVQVRRNGIRHEVGVVVEPGKRSRAAQRPTVGRRGEVSPVVSVTGRERAVQVVTELAELDLPQRRTYQKK
jgi:hypothetical protein